MFQKANGINVYLFISTWIFYSLCVGLLQILLYCGIFSAYINYFTEHYTNHSQATSIALLCNSIILTYLSTFAYIFFFSILIPTKQVGLKIITVLLILSYFVIGPIAYGDVAKLN
jgi:hypothetical protein